MSANIEQRVAKLEEFAADVRAYTQILTEMIRRHDERLDEVRAEAANADVRIAALADAQIQTEDAIRALVVAQGHTDGALAQLIVRVDRLTAALEQHTTDGHGG
jgi:inactivated superfamily I helicase